MAKSPKPAATSHTPTEDQNAAPAPEAATGDQTPDAGNTGAAEAGAAVGAATPVEAAQPVHEASTHSDPLPDAPVEKPQPVAKGKKPESHIVLVKGPVGGRGRINLRFGPEPVEVDCALLTEAQQKALGDDPYLTITRKD